jgi:hypothetical protein
MGKHSEGSTTHNSPRSSTGTIPPQIHIHMNSIPSATAAREGDRERHSDTDRGRDSDRHHQNRGRRDSMFSSSEISPSSLRKLVTTHFGSPNSSSGHASDTASFGDGSSSTYSVDGNNSVFSESNQPTRRPHTNGFRHSEVGVQLPHGSKTHQRRGNHLQQNYDSVTRGRASHIEDSDQVDDYPHFRSVPYHARVHRRTSDHGDEPHFDDHTAGPYAQRPQPLRRSTVQVPISNHNPTSKPFQPHGNLAYSVADGLPSPIYTNTYPQSHYINDTALDSPNPLHDEIQDFKATIAALQQKVGAAERAQAQAQRRPLLRRNTMSARDPTGEVDEWESMRPQMPLYERGSGRMEYRSPTMRA